MNRAYRSFWILTVVTVLAIGLVTQALAAPAGPGSDVVLAGSAVLLVASTFLLVRVSRFLSRGR